MRDRDLGSWMSPTPLSQEAKHGEPTEWELSTDHAATRDSLRVAVAKGMWPTPNARQGGGGEYKDPQKILERMKKGHQKNLGDMVKLWPTPTTQEIDHPWMELTETGRRLAKDGENSHSLNLADTVKMWPTPQAADNRDRGNMSTPAIKRRIEKGKQVMLSMSVSEKSGALNPEWVEWLMGFPAGWTNLEKPRE
jgi:hypothetical protein